MSAKKGDNVLMIPGPEGWEVWSGSNATGYAKVLETEFHYALEVDKVPNGTLNFAIPVRQLVALPMKAQTDDLSLLGDLATMHLERSGVRPMLDGGELADYFVYSSDGSDSVVTPVVLSPPVEGELPRKSPEAFDISARCLPMPRGKLAIWRELGRWVFGLGDGERLLYFQCLSGERLDDRAGRDIRLALTQLQLQGVLPELPSEIMLWTTGGMSDPRQEEVEALARGADLTLDASPKPAPHWPTPPSRLLPADVRAERMEVKGRRNRNILIAAAAIAYLGVIAFFYNNYTKANDKAFAMEKKVRALGPGTQDLILHQEKWDELQPVVEAQFHPYEVFYRVAKVAPRGPDMPLRLTQVTILNQYREKDGTQEMYREIVLRGNAAEFKDVGAYNTSLTQSEELSEFKWITPPGKKAKSGRWDFTYTADANPEVAF